MRTISKIWRNLYLSLGQVDPKCPLENALIKQTMRPWKYANRAEEIAKILKAEDTILEIGCGYGGLALEILKLVPVKYTIVENELMLAQAKKFLGDRVEYIEAGRIETLRDRKFTMFISYNCLSETPAKYRKYVLENIIKNSQKISIRDLNDTFKPTPKMLKDGYEMIPMNIEKWVKKYFIIEKIVYHRNQLVLYSGERRK